MKKDLNNWSSLGEVDIGHTWQSATETVTSAQLAHFRKATGESNPHHADRITRHFFKSRLGGRTCPGVMILGLASAGVHRIFQFAEDTEIITDGYDSAEFKRPLHVGAKFYYNFTLLERKVEKATAECKWRIDVMDERGKLLATAVWRIYYSAVKRTRVGEVVRTASHVVTNVKALSPALLLVVGLLWMTFSFHPPCDTCFPDGP